MNPQIAQLLYKLIKLLLSIQHPFAKGQSRSQNDSTKRRNTRAHTRVHAESLAAMWFAIKTLMGAANVKGVREAQQLNARE